MRMTRKRNQFYKGQRAAELRAEELGYSEDTALEREYERMALDTSEDEDLFSDVDLDTKERIEKFNRRRELA